jgi:hypothetical protein
MHLCIWQKMGHLCILDMVLLETFFFSRKPIFFALQLATHGGLKFSNFQIFDILFDMVPQPPALNGSKKHLLGHISSFYCYNFLF